MSAPDKPNYAGATVNERLLLAGLIGEWNAAVKSRDRNRMIEILCNVQLESQAAEITDRILAHPNRYGF